MELFKSILMDFCLFSLIEGFIYCYFFTNIGNLNHFNLKEIIIISIGNCIISQIFPPLFYQFIMILWMGFILKYFKNIKFIYGCKLVIKCMIFMLIIEMNFSIIFEIIFELNFITIGILRSFLIFLILKFIEFNLIKLYKKEKNQMKTWWGEVRK